MYIRTAYQKILFNENTDLIIMQVIYTHQKFETGHVCFKAFLEIRNALIQFHFHLLIGKHVSSLGPVINIFGQYILR